MVTRLEAAHARNRLAIEREADRQLRRAWLAGDEDIFVEQAVLLDELAVNATVSEVDGYLATWMTAAAGIQSSPRGLEAAGHRRPVDPEEQWRRPFKHMRIQLADGAAFPEAARFGGAMASSMLATNLQFAARGSSRTWIGQEESATGYRRVTTSAKPCGLCIAATDQLYHREQLMPIHDNCHCTVRPVSLDRRYGLSEGRYQEVLDQTGGDTSREALSKVHLDEAPTADVVEFRVVEHGELGPYLFDARHSPPLLDAAA